MEKFNNLPKEIKGAVNSPAAAAAIALLEKKYGLSLAVLIIRVAVKDVLLGDLSAYFQKEHGLDAGRSAALVGELKATVLKDILDYLSAGGAPAAVQAEDGHLPINKILAHQTASDFFFSADDEEEIQAISARIKKEEPAAEAADIGKKTDLIVRQADINFGSQFLADRFRQIIFTYIKGVRDRIITRQSLLKEVASGGLGFDAESADKVMAIADQVRGGEVVGMVAPKKMILPEDLANQPAVKTEGLKLSGVRDVEYDFSALPKRKEELAKGEPPANLPIPDNESQEPVEPEAVLFRPITGNFDLTHELPAYQPQGNQALAIKEAAGQEPAKKLIKKSAIIFAPARKVAPAASAEIPGISASVKAVIKAKEELSVETAAKPVLPRAVEIRPAAEPNGKIRMDDVKLMPKTMGPIDELKYMDLVNFRRLNKDPISAAAKIKDKIRLLEDDHYAKRLEGIRAWRVSPINRLYLEMGHESISHGRAINAIIEERKAAKADFLEIGEFEAILDLNKDFRY